MHSYVAYIDESGDDGLTKYREPRAHGGSSQFLTICACIIRTSYETDAVSWRDEIKVGSGSKTQGRSIHFTDLNHSQRRYACQCISGKPLRFISATAHKPSLQSEVYQAKNRLYFYIARHVIERISWFCRDMRPKVREGDGRVRIVFSRRGGMSYPDFIEYLNLLKDQETSIYWPVIDLSGIEAQDHSRLAGLQLADCGAKSMADAFEPDKFGNVERQYLEILRDQIYSRKGNFVSYGFKLLPDSEEIEWSTEQAKSLQLLS